MPVVIGIDIGLSRIKVAAFNEHSDHLAMVERPNDSIKSSGMCVEADMTHLWRTVCNATRQVTSSLTPELRPEAVGLSGHGNGIYLISGSKPLLGITSLDRRGAGVVDLWDRSGTNDLLFKYTGSHPWPGQTLALLAALDDLPHGIRMLFCKDWIRYCLTGNFVTDRGDASAAGLIDLRSGQWCKKALDIALNGRSCPILPDISDSNQCTGTVTQSAADETGLDAGTKVACGSVDFALGALGDDLSDDSTLHVTAGTWAINQRRTKDATANDRIFQTISSPWTGEFLAVESSPTSAINLQWIEQMFQPELDGYAQFEKWVSRIPDDVCAPMYTPYPFGVWDLRGANANLLNLKPSTEPRDIVRAVYEGIALGHKRQIDKYLQSGSHIRRLIVTGGLSRSAGWCQMLSDCTGIPVEVSDNTHAGIWGAALCAFSMLEISCTASYNRPKRYCPNFVLKDYYDARYWQFMDCLNSRPMEETLGLDAKQ